MLRTFLTKTKQTKNRFFQIVTLPQNTYTHTIIPLVRVEQHNLDNIPRLFTRSSSLSRKSGKSLVEKNNEIKIKIN